MRMILKRSFAFLILFVLVYSPALPAPKIFEKKYHGFTLWLDRQRHGAVAFYYELDRDDGSISRSGGFKIDSSVPEACQPISATSYRTDTVDPATGTWDRGHLIPANHMDNNLLSMKDTFFIPNILPQQSDFNQTGGAWFETEKISECYRDISRLSIWGGFIWGDDNGNDFFVGTHGIDTPDFWWKLIYRHDTKDFNAWIFPNDRNSRLENIDQFLVTIRDIKEHVDFVPDFGEIEQFPDDKPDHSWPVSGNQMVTCEGITTDMG